MSQEVMPRGSFNPYYKNGRLAGIPKPHMYDRLMSPFLSLSKLFTDEIRNNATEIRETVLEYKRYLKENEEIMRDGTCSTVNVHGRLDTMYTLLYTIITANRGYTNASSIPYVRDASGNIIGTDVVDFRHLGDLL